jgi:uncharacterized membrane protein YadS
MVAALTATRILCFILAVLFLILAVRAQFDDAVNMPWLTATLSAAGFGIAGAACGWLRKVIVARANGG